MGLCIKKIERRNKISRFLIYFIIPIFGHTLLSSLPQIEIQVYSFFIFLIKFYYQLLRAYAQYKSNIPAKKQRSRLFGGKGGVILIVFHDVCKTYRIARRGAGLGNAAKSLFKREYSMIHAINHVSFSINDGEMIGLLGPNGAGKSSTIKILSGILTPDSGTCLVNEQVPWKNRKAYVRQIGVVFGQRSQLWWDIPVMDSFDLLRAIYSIPESKYRDKLDELTQLLHLEELLKTPTRQLSLGQRMRCEIAASLLHEPSLLFLDEPTIGLDAVSKIAVRDFIKKMNEEHQTTVILTTHDMQDIEAITNRVILIGKGRKLMDGTLDDLRLEAASLEDHETDLDHIIARLYEKLNIV